VVTLGMLCEIIDDKKNENISSMSRWCYSVKDTEAKINFFMVFKTLFSFNGM
jgi:hypothetical protein